MALKLNHVLRETSTNLRRNLLMSTAAVVTVAISLSLVGGALLLRQGVNNATLQWRNGVMLSIFMNPDATQQQFDAVQQQLSGMPEVKSSTFVDKPAAYAEAQKLFASDPVTLSNLSPETMPPSYRVVPTNTKFIDSIKERFDGKPGVKSVVLARDAIRTMENIARILQISLLVVAVVLLASASMLILNAIRIAIFARRREVSVMKLVGATNWFIRVPFMLEGLLQGLIGAGIAFAAVLGTRIAMASASRDPSYTMLRNVVATPEQAVWTGMLVVGVGVVVGVAGSLAAVHRFLDT